MARPDRRRARDLHGGAAIAGAARAKTPPEVLAVAAGSALTLGAIDVVYVAKGRIAPTYLVDAAIQAALLAGLAVSRPAR